LIIKAPRFVSDAVIPALCLGFCLSTIVRAQESPRKPLPTVEVPASTGAQDREYWSNLLFKMASPVIFNLADGTLKKNMPLEKAPGYSLNAEKVAYLEAVGRTMAGVAPWLALPDDDSKEGMQRRELRKALLKGLANGFDPGNPDFLNFKTEQQPLVDAAYMAQAFLRAPKALWEPLDSGTKQRVIESFKSLRTRTASYNNWLLFSGITEAFLLKVGEQADPARIRIAQMKVNEWYVGDGWYSDGPIFSIDYYNSYVFHSMMVDFLKVLLDKKWINEDIYKNAVRRLMRYSEFLERLIGPDGSYPPFGRSMTYRTGAFQALAQTALMQNYPEGMSPAQVRCSMTAVMHRMYDQCNNFDDKGWLLLGFCGHQPSVADYYTCTGSLYMATLAFLPLGLPANNKFWVDPPEAWISNQAWSGKPFKKDFHVSY